MTHIAEEVVNNKNSALSIFVGECLGTGSSRNVYALKGDPKNVLKIEHSAKTFHNQTEWLVWEVMSQWPISDWFAPCRQIDGYGNALIQARTEPFNNDKEFKAAITRTRGGVIPAVFDDIHYGNFGMLDGRVACHDYGYHRFFDQIAREMSIEAGYITFDEPELEPYDVTDEGQLALDL